MEKTPLKRYSQAFKQQIVREYEAGATASQLSQKYGIMGGSTWPWRIRSRIKFT